MKSSPFPLIPQLTALLLLSGCASSALKDAPSAPDQPWYPGTDKQGMIVPNGSGKNTHQALRMPPGYALPTDHSLAQQRHDPVITPDHTYTLAELIDIAQSTNPDTRIAWDTARDAALSTGLARSAYLPQLTAIAVGGYASLGSHLRNSSSYNRNSPHIHGDGNVDALSLQWLIFDFGKRDAVIDAAQQSALASNISFTGAHQKVIYAVTAAYYLYTASQAHIKLIEQARRNSYAIERAAKANLQHGQGTIIDVNQAEAATAQKDLQLVQARGEVENRYLALMVAIGISPTTRLSLHMAGDHPLTTEAVRLSDQMVQNAVARRPDVLAAYAAARASQSQIKAARAEFLPKIFATGNLSYTTGSLGISGLSGYGAASSLNVSNNNLGGAILGGITMPIFDGGVRQALLKQSQDKAQSAEVQLHHLEDEAVRDIVTSENNLRTSISTYNAALKLEKAAQTTFNAALSSYQNSESSITRVLDLQNNLFTATITRSDSYYSTLISAAALAFSTGSLSNSDPAQIDPTGL
ncbi:TolC family protein [Saccharibacter sp. 17.LH.SD]|uniref:TolC family protein n=1 Tax=Saccharibacter sp. 17.LH.SD TaxID=2689393 RepID=UPI00136885D0|nr:TolC family protein [Saccharibacter sp. 17.LH.SD]MXV44925.1 TolC family protein [Saccharibacter sp. 17.LH.SD]